MWEKRKELLAMKFMGTDNEVTFSLALKKLFVHCLTMHQREQKKNYAQTTHRQSNTNNARQKFMVAMHVSPFLICKRVIELM